MKRASLPLQRREFITLAGGAAAWPVVARAQQAAMPVVGFLGSASPDALVSEAMRLGLKDKGFVDGLNVTIENRYAHGQLDQLAVLAADLVRQRVAVIFASGGPAAALAAKAATSTIPIVFVNASDPVKDGLVVSLNRPGGNVTGVTFYSSQLVAKRLELLHEFLPKAALIGALANPKNPTAGSYLSDIGEAARARDLQLTIVRASTELEIDIAFANLVEHRAAAVFVVADAFLRGRRKQIISLAARHAMPASYFVREFVVDGGLMSYGGSFTDALRQAGAYAGRILNGERPEDLPVMQPTKFELVINLKTAKILGLTIPPKLLFTADEVIE